MEFPEFKRIVKCFADPGSIDFSPGKLVMDIRDEIIEAQLRDEPPNGLMVDENGYKLSAVTWIVTRLAHLHQLAGRISSTISPPEPFVKPRGRFLDHLDNDPSGQEQPDVDVVAKSVELGGRHLSGATSVVYLTSDAGEGKTSLIDHLAVHQAHKYQTKESSWLLVPITLGGRTFLRFDDVVISALVNRLRFQYLYYEAFIELVRLGVIVPALDGFEEMIIESSSRDAISALGGLLAKLRSAGSIFIATRTAFFDYADLRTQSKLLDTIGENRDVGFSRLALERWDRHTFTSYAKKRGVKDPEWIYQSITGQLGSGHPILTRAVLVKKLVDVANETTNLSRLLGRVAHDKSDYFFHFVEGIVDREAHYKWLDKSGLASSALLSTEEHHELLSMISEEMWIGATDRVGTDVLQTIAEIFAENRHKSPLVSRQIRERINQHSLLVARDFGRKLLEFDHEDFRVFYLGQAVGRTLVASNTAGVEFILDKAALPPLAVTEAAGYVRRSAKNDDRNKVLGLLQSLACGSLRTSFVRENCSIIALALIDGRQRPSELRRMSFPVGSLKGRNLRRVSFKDSYFHATSLRDTKILECRFEGCTFERLEFLDSTEEVSAKLRNCQINTVAFLTLGDSTDVRERFNPFQIKRDLESRGFEFCDKITASDDDASHELDRDLRITERFLRGFLRSTVLYENTISIRLGHDSSRFLKELLPELLGNVVLEKEGHGGRSRTRRYCLAARMTVIQEAMRASDGHFGRFLDNIRVSN